MYAVPMSISLSYCTGVVRPQCFPRLPLYMVVVTYIDILRSSLGSAAHPALLGAIAFGVLIHGVQEFCALCTLLRAQYVRAQLL